MDLATFGAILSYAMDLEERSTEYYSAAARGTLDEIFNDFAQGSKKRAQRMERTRREGVAEIILEPIAGLDGDDYGIDLFADASDLVLLDQAIALEKTAQRFYQDAAQKLPIREVVRTFKRMAQENEKRKMRLDDFPLPG